MDEESTEGHVTFNGPVDPNDTLITIHTSPSDYTPLVMIRPNGEIIYGPNYTPDAAAEVFWDSICIWGKNFSDVRNECGRLHETIAKIRDLVSSDRSGGDAESLAHEIRAILDGIKI